VKEARRIGLKDNEIMKYLDTEWMTNQDLEKLTKTLDVKNEYEQTKETKQ
jgi:hypothetical protein